MHKLMCAFGALITITYFCLNTVQYIHVVLYSECFITDAHVFFGEVCEDQWCLCISDIQTERLGINL